VATGRLRPIWPKRPLVLRTPPYASGERRPRVTERVPSFNEIVCATRGPTALFSAAPFVGEPI